MQDRALVAAMVAGDPRGLEGAYRAYAAPLNAYCQGLLRAPEAAADAVHDTFVLAGLRAGQLRDPDRLRAWLYAIARSVCLRQLRDRSRQVPLEVVGEVSAPPVDPGAAVLAGDVRELVWSAAAALNPGDRQVFELMIRHGLDAGEVGAVLGVSADHAHARLSRARTQLVRALGVLLVARGGAADCAELAGLVRGWDGVLTALLRKRLGRHIDECASCAERRRVELRPAALLSAYAALPFAVVPTGLWGRIQHTTASTSSTASTHASAGVAHRAGPFRRDTGFPPTSQVRRSVVATAVVAALLLIGAAILVAPRVAANLGPTGRAVASLGPAIPGGPTVAAPSTVPTPTPPTTSQAPTPGPATSGPPTRPPEPRDPPTSTGPTPAPALPAVHAEAAVVASPCPHYRLTVTATTTGAPIATGTLFWSVSGSAPVPVAMKVTGGVGRASVANLVSKTVTWSVRVVTTDHHTLTTEPRGQSSPCP